MPELIAGRGAESSAASALVAQALLPVRVRRTRSAFRGIGEINRPFGRDYFRVADHPSGIIDERPANHSSGVSLQ